MKFFYHIRRIIAPVFVVSTLLATGCAKQPLESERISPSPAAHEPAPDNTVVAKVNGVELYGKELDEIIYRLKTRNDKTAPSVSEEEMRKIALDELVLQELAIQEAHRQGLQVQQRDIEKTISAATGHKQEVYEDLLAKQKITDAQFRAKIERALLLRLIISQEVLKKANVTDDDVRKEYEDHKEQFVTSEKISVVDIFVPAKQEASSPQKHDYDAAVTKANELLSALNMHKDSNPWMLSRSRDDSFTVESRSLDKGKEPELYEAARKLQEGELSGIIQVLDGAHILKLAKIIPEHQMSYEEVKDIIAGKLKVVAQIKRLQEWQQELKKDAKIELLDNRGMVKSKKP